MSVETVVPTEAKIWSFPPEADRNNINAFTTSYENRLTTPLVIATPDGILTCGSHLPDVDSRALYLGNYLAVPGNPALSWGRTVFSEIVVADMLTRVFGEVLEREKLQINLATTSLDCSANVPGNEELGIAGQYRKGADIYITKPVDTAYGEVHIPLCAIDVTLNTNGGVDKKRARPGIQLDTGMPVLVFTVGDLMVGEGEKDNFIRYLDGAARDAVVEGNPAAYAGLHPDTVHEWERQLQEKTIEAAQSCRRGLLLTDDPRITSYSHLARVHRKLDFMEKAMERMGAK